MKTAMKLTTGILAMVLAVTGATQAVAQNPDAIDNARSIAKSLQQKQTNDTNAALEAAGVSNPAKPAAGAPAPAVKPVMISGAQPMAAMPAPKPIAVKTVSAKPTPAKTTVRGEHNQLQRVRVMGGGDTIEIEITCSASVTPEVSKLSSPARILVEMPDTVITAAQNKIAVGSGGVKGLRLGMDGKTPPSTSVVVDLEKPLAYEMSPGRDGKFILTLHTQGATVETAKSSPAPAAVPAASAKKAAPAPKVTVAKAAAPKVVAPKPEAKAKPEPKQAKAEPPAKPAPAAPKLDVPEPAKTADASKPPANAEKKDDKKEDKKWAMTGNRDPFFSPVRQENGGSGCSTGKKCLEIGNINLRGVVKSDNGFIAVVTNNLNKAYFLRENDPVFNGYVMKITGDSVTFQETVQDKLGKSFTREVVKRIFTPAV